MPQRKSAKRELKKSLKRRQLNLARKKAIKEAIKIYKKALKLKNLEEAKTALNQVYKVLDKAASKKVIHPKKAARKKSRLTALLTSVKVGD
jgi:small subunit ribosomal protein S20